MLRRHARGIALGAVTAYRIRRIGDGISPIESDVSGAGSYMLQESGVVFDVKRFALHDGPGIRTTVFLKGCPLSCAWCHNPEGRSRNLELLFWEARCTGCGTCIEACPANAVSIVDNAARVDRERCTVCGACVDVCPTGARAVAGEVWSVERILDVVEKDLLFYDESGGGVTLSGGEPLAQPAFAAALLGACRGRRIHTAVDTCGCAEWSALERVARETDLFLYDVKHVDAAMHKELTGVSNERILENLRRLSDGGHRLWIRYPLVPGRNDGEAEIIALGRLVACLDSVATVHLLPFHWGGERKLERLGGKGISLSMDVEPVVAAEVAAKILRGIVDIDVHVGG